jgi:cell division protein FtsB
MEKNRIVAVTTFSILVIYIIFLLSTVSDLRSEISKEKNENVLLLSDKSDLENQIIKLKDDTQYKRDKDCREEANNLRKRWYNVQSGRYSEVF